MGTDTPRYPRRVENEVVEVLKEIRDEVKETNSRLDSLEKTTNSRFEIVETRLRFVEKGLKDGFSELTRKIVAVAERQLRAESHLGQELVTTNKLPRGHAAQRKVDRATIRDHEKRITTLEKRTHGPKRP
jgi:hypothetical protein